MKSVAFTLIKQNIIIAVSYTHLDVYKRQIQTRPPIGEKKEIDPTKEKDAMDSLQEMIGLNNLKRSIAEHLNYVKLLASRKRAGLKASIPPLHMVFTLSLIHI